MNENNMMKIYPNDEIANSEYEDTAINFLKKHNITLKVIYDGKRVPNWDSKEHNTFNCILSTNKGSMSFNFYDSIVNTNKAKIVYPSSYDILNKAKIVYPSSYDILSCLQTYDVGTMDEFMGEFGYEIKSAKDMTNFIDTYNAVVKEYNDLKRCLTEEQIEELSEIS